MRKMICLNPLTERSGISYCVCLEVNSLVSSGIAQCAVKTLPDLFKVI